MEDKQIEQKSTVRLVELDAVDTSYPTTVESRKAWVGYGTNNDYPDYLLDLFLESPTNSAIITAVTNMVTGDGVNVLTPELNPIANAMVQKFFTPDIIKKMAFNLKLYGFAPVVVRGGHSVTGIEVSDGNKWRSGKKIDGVVEYWYYKERWEESKSQPKQYSLFSYNNLDEYQVFIFKLPMLGLDYYPPVDYNGGTSYIQLEAEIGEFHLSAIQHGLAPATMINFNNGIPPEEEMDKIEKDVNRKFGGPSNAGKSWISFNEGKDNASTIEALPTPDIDKQYEFLSREATSKIMVSHRVVSPIIFGIRDHSGMGNNAEELESSYKLYYETVIRGYQEIILDGMQSILYKNNVEFDAEWIEFMPFQREVVKDQADQTRRTPNLFDTNKKLTRFRDSKTIVAPNFKLIKELPFNGDTPKESSNVAILYKMNKVNPLKRDVFLKIMGEEENYYDFNFVQENPATPSYYWTECTFLKSKNDG